MKRRRRHVLYQVTVLGSSVWYNYHHKRWLLMSDPRMHTPQNHKGYASNKWHHTKEGALSSCRSLDAMVDRDAVIYVLRFTWPRGQRRIETLIYKRHRPSAKP